MAGGGGPFARVVRRDHCRDLASKPPGGEVLLSAKTSPEILVYSGCAQLAVDSCGEVEKCWHEPPVGTFLETTSSDYSYLQTAIALKQGP
jgi:hypothetical protein